MATVTRDDLAGAVAEEAGLTHRDARRLVDTVIEEMAARLEAGEAVKISSFGSFNLRDKGDKGCSTWPISESNGLASMDRGHCFVDARRFSDCVQTPTGSVRTRLRPDPRAR